MSNRIIDEAYARVRSRYSAEVWCTLPPRTVTDEIYKEIRLIDAERLDPAAAETPARQLRNVLAA